MEIVSEIIILKICKLCNESRPLDRFAKNRHQCRNCLSAKSYKLIKDKGYNKINYINNREKLLNYQKEYDTKKSILKKSLINI